MKDRDPVDDQRLFWEARHAEESLAHLSGVPGDDVLKCLGIESLVTPSAHILEIGVGLGTCLRYLGERCEAVYAVDIAWNALYRVRDVAKGSWLECEMDSLPPASFDLVYCFNVVIHLALETFSRHLQFVRPALKPGGVFAFQFNYRLDGGPGETAHCGALQAGAMTYSPDLLIALALSEGYSVVREIELDHVPGAAVGSYVLHITPVDR